jgi:hypothetical protein
VYVWVGDGVSSAVCNTACAVHILMHFAFCCVNVNKNVCSKNVAAVSVNVRFSNHCATSYNYEGAKFQIISKLQALKKVLKKIIFHIKCAHIKGTGGYYRKALIPLS